MKVLVSLAVFSILGILRVSAYEPRGIEVGYEGYEPKCFEKTTLLCESNAKILSLLKEHLILKDLGIKSLQGIVEGTNKCCGKESDENKCIEEVIFPPLQKLINDLSKYLYEYRGFITEAVANISKLAIYSENEMDYCCEKQIDVYVKKIELPTASFKLTINECKGEGTQSLNKFLTYVPEYMERLTTTYITLEDSIKDWEKVQKYKDVVPKEDKCKDKKALIPLKEAVKTLSLRFSSHLSAQVLLNWNYDVMVLENAISAIKEVLQYNGRKDIQY